MIATIAFAKIINALALGGFAAWWRWQDGLTKKALPASGVFAAIACIMAGFVAAIPISQSPGEYYIAIPVAVTFYLMIRGMPGWEYWGLNETRDGETRAGMLLGFAAPTAIVGVAWLILADSPWAIAYAASGTIIASVYVLGSQYEDDGGELPFGTAAELWGPLSYGTMVAGLVLLNGAQ